MKTSVNLNYTLRLTVMFALVMFVTSCQKSERIQTFNDVFDTSGIEALNTHLTQAGTLAQLPMELVNTTLKVPEKFNNVSPAEIAGWYQQNIRLTDEEIDLLLKNDSKTYIDVINRMASFPPGLGSLTADDFKDLKSSTLEKYLIKKIEEPSNFYSTDYYSAVLALQDYLKCSVIEPMVALNNLMLKESISNTSSGQFLTGCNSAFACLANGSAVCFLADFNRWGWSNPITPSATPYVLPLYAGAAKCDVTGMSPIGTVTITYPANIPGGAPSGTGSNMTVTYQMNPGYYIDEAHVYVGCAQYPSNNGITVAPGQYTFNATGLGSTSQTTVTFSGLSGCVYVIAHGVTCTGQGSGVKTFGPIARNLTCGNVCTPFPPAYILYYKEISLNNIWDMWWTYWSDGTRTKHKGAAGTFPG
jgi:hypothetical protein